MPTPAAGSELRTALTTTSQVTLSAMSTQRPRSPLFNASGLARRLQASPLFATGPLLCGFPGLDAPAGPRAAWQAASAPMIGFAAALGVLSSQTAPTAVVA